MKPETSVRAFVKFYNKHKVGLTDKPKYRLELRGITVYFKGTFPMISATFSKSEMPLIYDWIVANCEMVSDEDEMQEKSDLAFDDYHSQESE